MNTCNILHEYKNGNYKVRIYEDGSKIRFTLDDEFISAFPESIDIKITNHCLNNCPMCHESSSPKGKHALLEHKFLDTLSNGTELAIGGGNPLSHPDLEKFLIKMKEKGIICNITVNQNEISSSYDYLEYLVNNKLIYGLGISVISDCNLELIAKFINDHPNTVIHLIAGLIDYELLKKLYDKNYKILFLGYKIFGKGIDYYNIEIKENILKLKNSLKEISKRFYVVSFDNLALEQLDVSSIVSKEEYEKYFMGDDGLYTMYIDLVNEEYALSSTSIKRYELEEDIEKMFKQVKKEIEK